jgi:hypothetical protein
MKPLKRGEDQKHPFHILAVNDRHHSHHRWRKPLIPFFNDLNPNHNFRLILLRR